MNFSLGGVIPLQLYGSVICYYQNGSTWRFTTIESPKDWNHPVSGTREFGLITNEDGTYTLYTRGVDGVAEAGDFLMEEFKKGNYDKIEIVYNEFKNVATQILRIEQFLPVVPLAKSQSSSEVDYIYQPDKVEIITGLIPKSLKVQLFKALLDSNASENGARMTAMDKATENAGELLKELKLTYNRTRQAAITKEILEIVAGAEALKSA
jgi:F-type H+-transporting ATPase subunit gamma